MLFKVTELLQYFLVFYLFVQGTRDDFEQFCRIPRVQGTLAKTFRRRVQNLASEKEHREKLQEKKAKKAKATPLGYKPGRKPSSRASLANNYPTKLCYLGASSQSP